MTISKALDFSTRRGHSLALLITSGQRAAGPVPLAALSMLSIALACGCGNNGGSGSSDTNGNGNGSGAAGGNGAAPFSGAVLCANIFSADSTSGFIRLVSDEELETGEEIDGVQSAIEVGGGTDCAVQGRRVFSLNWESPTITRYDEANGALSRGPTVSLANFGLTSAIGSHRTFFVSDTKAYFLDDDGFQIIVWNPSTMETIGSISLSVPEVPEGLRPNALTGQLLDDGVLVVYDRYVDQQSVTASLTNFWFVDTETDQVVGTDGTEECGGLVPSATATNGDLYIGSGPREASNYALDLPGSFRPCAVRIRAGTRELDTTFMADLNGLADGLPTNFVFAPTADRLLLVSYDSNSVPVDPTLTPRELGALENWIFYEWELGSEEPASRVENIPTSTGFVTPITYEGTGTSYLRVDAGDFSWTELVDVTKNPVETAFRFTNTVYLLARLGSDPDTRMAQQIEHRGGLSLLSFSDFGN